MAPPRIPFLQAFTLGAHGDCKGRTSANINGDLNWVVRMHYFSCPRRKALARKLQNVESYGIGRTQELSFPPTLRAMNLNGPPCALTVPGEAATVDAESMELATSDLDGSCAAWRWPAGGDTTPVVAREREGSGPPRRDPIGREELPSPTGWLATCTPNP